MNKFPVLILMFANKFFSREKKELLKFLLRLMYIMLCCCTSNEQEHEERWVDASARARAKKKS